MDNFLDIAIQYKGVPYKSGGMDKNGLDCSGLINLVTGQDKRVWTTSSNVPPPGTEEIKYKAISFNDFTSQLLPGDILLWKGHAAFFVDENTLFHARSSGKPADYTKDLQLYWLKVQGYPKVYRQCQ